MDGSPKRIGAGMETQDGLVLSAVRGLAHRTGCTYEQALEACRQYREQHPAPPERSTPDLIEAAEPVATMTRTDRMPTDAQWWEVPDAPDA